MNTELLGELFGGAGRYRALAYIFEDPGRDFGPRELAQHAGIDSGNATRWLRRWAALGLVQKTTVLDKVRYSASKDPSLKHLGLLLQEGGQLARDFKERLGELGDRVQTAAIFGSVAKGTASSDSDIDLLLLGEVPRLEAQAFFKPLGRKLRRPVNVTVFTPQEWSAALAANNPLAVDINSSEKIALKGTLDAA
jgi:predicted nucleotidyltransferase